MSAENVEIARGGYDAFSRGDIDAVLSMMDPDIVWQEPDVEGIPAGGTHHGREAVAENVFGRVSEDWDEFQVVPEEFLDAGDRVVVLGLFQGKERRPAGRSTLPSPTSGLCARGRWCISATTRTRPTGYKRSVKPPSGGPGFQPRFRAPPLRYSPVFRGRVVFPKSRNCKQPSSNGKDTLFRGCVHPHKPPILHPIVKPGGADESCAECKGIV